jgi:hypothetical protein
MAAMLRGGLVGFAMAERAPLRHGQWRPYVAVITGFGVGAQFRIRCSWAPRGAPSPPLALTADTRPGVVKAARTPVRSQQRWFSRGLQPAQGGLSPSPAAKVRAGRDRGRPNLALKNRKVPLRVMTGSQCHEEGCSRGAFHAAAESAAACG